MVCGPGGRSPEQAGPPTSRGPRRGRLFKPRGRELPPAASWGRWARYPDQNRFQVNMPYGTRN